MDDSKQSNQGKSKYRLRKSKHKRKKCKSFSNLSYDPSTLVQRIKGVLDENKELKERIQQLEAENEILKQRLNADQR